MFDKNSRLLSKIDINFMKREKWKEHRKNCISRENMMKRRKKGKLPSFTKWNSSIVKNITTQHWDGLKTPKQTPNKTPNNKV